MMTARQIGLSACVLAVLLLGLSLFGGRKADGASAPLAVASALHAQDAWVRLPAVRDRPAGGFLVIHGGSQADALTSAISPLAQRIEIHSMAESGGVMRMRHEKSLAVPARGQLQLAPGGNHLMLFDLDPSVKPGDVVPLTLGFQSGAEINIHAVARAPGATPPAEAGGQHEHSHH